MNLGKVCSDDTEVCFPVGTLDHKKLKNDIVCVVAPLHTQRHVVVLPWVSMTSCSCVCQRETEFYQNP